jgi:hypothetical protein
MRTLGRVGIGTAGPVALVAAMALPASAASDPSPNDGRTPPNDSGNWAAVGGNLGNCNVKAYLPFREPDGETAFWGGYNCPNAPQVAFDLQISEQWSTNGGSSWNFSPNSPTLRPTTWGVGENFVPATYRRVQGLCADAGAGQSTFLVRTKTYVSNPNGAGSSGPTGVAYSPTYTCHV